MILKLGYFVGKLYLLVPLLLVGCNSYWKPTVETTWQWQLEGPLNISYDVDAYNVDLFDTPTSSFQQLHSQGKKVICYFSAGSLENWREDRSLFNTLPLGASLSGWPGETWLDIRDKRVWAIMAKRLDYATLKGCDAIEPDNIDGYANMSGFPLTYRDQLLYNRYLASEAHKRGLAIGLKNDLDQVIDLVDYFDFAINEQCLEYNECDVLTVFVNQGKPVFHVEYPKNNIILDESESTNLWQNKDILSYIEVCRNLEHYGFQSLLLPKDLDDEFRFDCNNLTKKPNI
jgi:hypothetical protein